MNKRRRLLVIVLAFAVIALLTAGAASAVEGTIGDDPTESTLSTDTTLPADPPEGGDPPEGTDPPEGADPLDGTEPPEGDDPDDLDDPDEESGVKPDTFGQIISALRHAGDHTPAAIIMGKEVPGWDPEKHPGSTTDTTAYPPGQAGQHDGDGDTDDGEDDGAGGEEDETDEEMTGSSNGKPDKGHVPAAVLKGKNVPGHSK